jgi:hypothetical protein
MKTTVFDIKCGNNCGASILHVEYSGNFTMRVRLGDILQKEADAFEGCFCFTCLAKEAGVASNV